MTTGTLLLIVGPSGAGKDTLIDGARTALKDDPRFIFARRVITRPAEAGGEDHEPTTDAEFARREHGGEFMMTWRAHGLCYGLPKSLENDLASGRNVIANVSRATLAAFAERFPSARVIEITAPPALRAQRLARRGREDAADIAERLAREVPRTPTSLRVSTVDNDASPEDGIKRLLVALTDREAEPC